MRIKKSTRFFLHLSQCKINRVACSYCISDFTSDTKTKLAISRSVICIDEKFVRHEILRVLYPPAKLGRRRAMHDKCIYFRGEDIYGDAKEAEVTNVSKRSMFVKLQYLYTSAG